MDLLGAIKDVLARAEQPYPQGMKMPPKTFHVQIRCSRDGAGSPTPAKVRKVSDKIVKMMSQEFPGCRVDVTCGG